MTERTIRLPYGHVVGVNRKDQDRGLGRRLGRTSSQRLQAKAGLSFHAELPLRPAGHQEASRVTLPHSLLENTVHSSVVGGLAGTGASVEAVAVASKE